MFNLRPFGTQEVYGWIYVGLMVVIYLLWEAAFTMNDIGYWGAIPSLSRDKKKRDQLTSMTIFFAGIGSGAIALFVGVFSPGNILTAYTIYSIIACVAMIGCQTMVCLKVKEGPRDDGERPEEGSLKRTFKIIFGNKQLLTMSLGYLIYDVGSGILGALIYNLYYLEYGYDGTFAVVSLGMGVVSMVFQALYPKITKRWSREKIQRTATIMMIFGYLWIFVLGWTDILPFTPITLAVGFLLNGIAGTYFYISTLINMTNCVEYNEYLTGERNEAIVSAVRPLIVKFSSATRSLLTTLILICSGLYVLSQNVSSLETQKGLFNDKVAENITEESLSEMKEYVRILNEYNAELSLYDKESDEYEAKLDEITDEIDALGSSHVVVRVQTKADFIDTYCQMYILKKQDGNIIEFEQIKNLNNDKANKFFVDGYEYEATFVFSYEDQNGNKVDVNLGTDVYKESDSLTTRIVLRVMVTILPIVIVITSYYIQNKKFIVNEEFYNKMMEELEERRKVKSLN
jgi:Na+/melibiose symporter-like transporter